MLEWTGAGAGARLEMLVHHDDAEREFAYGPSGRTARHGSLGPRASLPPAAPPRRIPQLSAPRRDQISPAQRSGPNLGPIFLKRGRQRDVAGPAQAHLCVSGVNTNELSAIGLSAPRCLADRHQAGRAKRLRDDLEGARRERHQIRLPTVQVVGEGDTSTATVAVAQRALELAKPAAV